MKLSTGVRCFAAGVVTAAFLGGTAHGAVDMFLKIDGIPGDSTDAQHPNEISISGYTHDLTAPVTSTRLGGGAGTGKVSFSDLTIQKTIDKSSPKLMLACCTGQHIKQATITCRKAGGDQQPVDYLKITMTDVLVSSYSTSGAAGDGAVPADSFSLNFSKIQFDYSFQSREGGTTTLSVGYDVKNNIRFLPAVQFQALEQ